MMSNLLPAVLSTLIIFFVVVVSPEETMDYHGRKDLKELWNKVFKGYDHSKSPPRPPGTYLNITAVLRIYHVEQVNETQQTISFHGGLDLRWRDSRLKWNSSITKETEIELSTWKAYKRTKLWMPTTSFMNLADSKNRARSMTKPGYSRRSLKVYRTGYVALFKPISLSVTCNFDYAKFPYDDQSCPVVLILHEIVSTERFKWAYTTIDTDKQDLLLEAVSPNQKQVAGGWIVDKYHFFGGNKKDREIMFYDWRTNKLTANEREAHRLTYSVIRFWIHLRRNSPFHIWLGSIPAVLVTLLSPIGLLMDNDQLSLTILLGCLTSLGLYLNELMEIVPPATTGAPKIVRFYSYALIFVFIGLLMRFVRNKAKQGETTEPITKRNNDIYNFSIFIFSIILIVLIIVFIFVK